VPLNSVAYHLSRPLFSVQFLVSDSQDHTTSLVIRENNTRCAERKKGEKGRKKTVLADTLIPPPSTPTIEAYVRG
jgi:hypothetical protein